MKNLISDIIDRTDAGRIIYGIWIILSLIILALFLIKNSHYIDSHSLTLIIAAATGILTLTIIRKLNLHMLLYTVPISLVAVSVLFRYSLMPEVIIITVNRLLLVIFSIPSVNRLLPKNNALKTVFINLVIIIISLEIVLRIVFFCTQIDILKRKGEIMRPRPGSIFNGIRINSEGFPGESPFAESEPKWLFTGDSFGVGIVDYQYNFIHITGESFGITDINLSQPGNSPYDYYRILSRYISAVDAERVFVILFTGNDVSEWYIPENGWSYENMRTVNLARNILMLVFRNIPAQGRLKHSYEELLSIEIRRITETRRENVDKWDRYRDYLAKISELGHKSGIRLQYIIIPDRYEVDSGLQDSIVSRLGYSPDFSYARTRTLDILDSLKADYIDTYNELSSEGAEGFAPLNTHIDRSGNRAVYRSLAQYLRNETLDKK